MSKIKREKEKKKKKEKAWKYGLQVTRLETAFCVMT